MNPHTRPSIAATAILAAIALTGTACTTSNATNPGAAEQRWNESDHAARRPRLSLTATQRVALRERAIEVVERLALAPDPQLRANAIEGVRWAPRRAEPIVRAALADSNPGVRFAAAMTAGRLQLQALLPLIEPLITDNDRHVRLAALFAASELGQNANLQPLADALRSGDTRLRAQAAFVLGEMGNPSAAPMILEAAREAPTVGFPSQQALFDLQAAEARLKLGDRDATDAIIGALYPATVDGFEASVLAAQIIGQQGIRDGIGQLVTIVESRAVRPGQPTDWRNQNQSLPKLYPIELRLAAATSLARLGYRDGRPVADEALASSNILVRAQAAHLLAELARDPDIATLTTLLDAPQPRVQVAAATALLEALAKAPRR